MKRFFLTILSAAALCSCAPQSYVMQMDMRYPSSSGMDLDGKTVSVVYLETPSSRDTIFNNSLSDGFAQGLEKEYFKSHPEITVYGMTPDPSGNYCSKDSLASLIMTLDTDVVFLVDKPAFSEVSAGNLNYQARIFGYDSMDPSDKVYGLSHNGKITSDYSSGSMFTSDAQMAGLKMSEPLINSWKPEQFTLIYFDMDSRWVNAIMYADSNQWQDAMNIWLELADSKTGVQLTSAAYNLAMGCYVMREYELALEWLDLSDKTQPVSLSKNLRKRIQDRMNLK